MREELRKNLEEYREALQSETQGLFVTARTDMSLEIRTAAVEKIDKHLATLANLGAILGSDSVKGKSKADSPKQGEES
jgi:hypothetical protein